MFKEMDDRSEKATRVARWLADHKQFKMHNRHISRSQIQGNHLVVRDLEDDEILQDLSLPVFHATIHTFTGTPAVKIVENHIGRAFIKHQIIQPT